jgi:hypothetical protein
MSPRPCELWFHTLFVGNANSFQGAVSASVGRAQILGSGQTKPKEDRPHIQDYVERAVICMDRHAL